MLGKRPTSPGLPVAITSASPGKRRTLSSGRRRPSPSAAAAAAPPSPAARFLRAAALLALAAAAAYVLSDRRAAARQAELHSLEMDLARLFRDGQRDLMLLAEARANGRRLEGEAEYAEWVRDAMIAEVIKGEDLDEIIGQHNGEEEALRRRIRRMEDGIAGLSRADALQRFGPGPHRVEFTLQFLDGSGTFASEPAASRTNKFIIEMAPLDLMPHSILHFLDMIDGRLWDGAAIIQHVDHVIQAVPTEFRTANGLAPAFEAAGLSELAFQEYHEEYPHEEYTVGFSGRPGGLEFYINTQDNSAIHGPGGQMQHILHEEGDPCFGVVTLGRHVIDRINQKGVKKKRDINIVGIESARLLPSASDGYRDSRKLGAR